MTALLDILFAPPTVFFTVPMLLVALYWVTVVIGAADLDVFDGAIGGAAEGLDGAIDGAMDGAIDGALDGAADGALDGAADAADAPEVEADAPTAGFGMLRWLAFVLRLGKVPVTITASLLVFSGWCTSFALTWLFGGTAALPPVAMHLSILAASTAVGSAVTNLLSRPLEPVFHLTRARGRSSLVGEICEVSTGRVDGRFGQATAMIEGDDLLLQIRCDSAENGLGRGARALIVSFDAKREAFVVEPLAAASSTASSDATSTTGHRAGAHVRRSEAEK